MLWADTYSCMTTRESHQPAVVSAIRRHLIDCVDTDSRRAIIIVCSSERETNTCVSDPISCVVWLTDFSANDSLINFFARRTRFVAGDNIVNYTLKWFISPIAYIITSVHSPCLSIYATALNEVQQLKRVSNVNSWIAATHCTTSRLAGVLYTWHIRLLVEVQFHLDTAHRTITCVEFDYVYWRIRWRHSVVTRVTGSENP